VGRSSDRTQDVTQVVREVRRSDHDVAIGAPQFIANFGFGQSEAVEGAFPDLARPLKVLRA